MDQAFIGICAAGSPEEIDNALSSNSALLYAKDELGRNGALAAAANANWRVLIHLLINHRISPHAIDSKGNGILHALVDGTVKRPATIDDLNEIHQDLLRVWSDEYIDTLSRLQSTRAVVPDKRPPTSILLKKPEDLDKKYFGNPKVFLAKYLMERFHVVVDRKNSEEKNPSQYALDINEIDLATEYETASDYHPSRRRLLQGLNDQLIRLVGNYL